MARGKIVIELEFETDGLDVGQLVRSVGQKTLRWRACEGIYAVTNPLLADAKKSERALRFSNNDVVGDRLYDRVNLLGEYLRDEIKRVEMGVTSEPTAPSKPPKRTPPAKPRRRRRTKK